MGVGNVKLRAFSDLPGRSNALQRGNEAIEARPRPGMTYAAQERDSLLGGAAEDVR